MWTTWNVVASVAMLAGCAMPVDHGGFPIDRPDGWDQTPAFVPFNGFRAHSADQSLQARAPDDWTGAQPAGCQAYQDGVHHGGDSCRVVPTPPEHYWGEGPKPAWYIDAEWDGAGEDVIGQERDEGRRTVVVFDEAGIAIGHVPRAVAFSIE